MVIRLKVKSQLARKLPTTTYTICEPGDLNLANRWSSNVTISIDAEWANETLKTERPSYEKALLLTSQFTWRESDGLKGLLVWHPTYDLPPTHNVPELTELFIVLADPEHTNPYTLGMCNPKSNLNILMFYAPHDVRALVGTELWKTLLLWNADNPTPNLTDIIKTAAIDKKRKLNGRWETIHYGKGRLYDVIGTCTAGMGLDKFHESVGIDSPYKRLSKDHDKSHMELWMKSNPDTFLQYAMGDTLFLEDALTKRVEQVNTMIQDALGFSPEYILPWETPDPNTLQTRFPMSAGSLVSTTFEKHLEHDDRYNRVLTALLPLTLYSDAATQKHFTDLTLRGFTYAPSFKPLSGLPRKAIGNPDKEIEVYHPISLASIPGLQYSVYSQSSGLLAAIVYGGRCVNERQDESFIHNVLDIDLNSCYGSALTTLTLPIGFPTIYQRNPSDTKPPHTLRTFLNAHERELVDDCYAIYVEGTLGFEQDYIASKPDVDAAKIRKLAGKFVGGEDITNDDTGTERDDETAHIPGTMVHILSELTNGVITSDILKTIRAVSSEKEINGWMNLTVTTAIYYAKSGRIDDVTKFEQACAVNTPMQFDEKAVPVFPNIWYPYPFSDFVGSLVNTRKDYKKKGKTDPLFNLLQNGLKLFINTTYGCLASPYFSMGNTVIANVITARARTGAWMMAKSLGSVQSITDGGAYSHDSVRTIKPHTKRDDRPSFNTLANYDRTTKHRNIKTTQLTTLPFTTLKQKLHANDNETITILETTALTHINTFWQHYGLTLPFAIEHKYENTCDVMAFSGSANYLMIGSKSDKTALIGTHNVGYTLKARGVKTHNNDTHCKETHLWALAGFKDMTTLYTNASGQLTQPYSSKSHLIGVKEWQTNPQRYLEHGLFPGDAQISHEPFKPNENYKLPKTVKEWKAQQKEHERYSRQHDKELDTLGPDGRAFGVRKHKDPKRKGAVGSKFPTVATLPLTTPTSDIRTQLINNLKARDIKDGTQRSHLDRALTIDALILQNPDLPQSLLLSLA